MDRASVNAWVARYERVWREDDRDALDTLFTPDVRYVTSPYEPPMDGIEAVRSFWSDPTPFTMTWSVVAVDPPYAVVRADVHYGGDRPREYRDLWVLRTAEDGRVVHFEEWPFAPSTRHPAAE